KLIAHGLSFWGFTPDDSSAFFVGADGRVYVWPTNTKPREVMRLQSLADWSGKPFAVDIPRTAEEPVHRLSPIVGIFPNGKALWSVDGQGSVYVAATDPQAGLPPRRVGSLALADLTEPNVRLSSNADWIAFSDRSDEIKLLRISDGALNPLIRFPSQD